MSEGEKSYLCAMCEHIIWPEEGEMRLSFGATLGDGRRVQGFICPNCKPPKTIDEMVKACAVVEESLR